MAQHVFVGRVAEFYDATSREMSDPVVIGPTVDFLAELAGEGAALEFAIGTGRVALPLHRRGVEVHGACLPARTRTRSMCPNIISDSTPTSLSNND